MGVRWRIHPVLQNFTAGHEMVEVVGRTVGECLDALEAQYPGVKRCLCDEEGGLSGLFDIYVNWKGLYPDELDKAVRDGDELSITPVLLGGG